MRCNWLNGMLCYHSSESSNGYHALIFYLLYNICKMKVVSQQGQGCEDGDIRQVFESEG